jgi:V/A-type H+-transporting ATPase subunit E
MTSELKVEDLENALMQRANDLAEEYLQRAKRSHDHFIDDENERLKLREEKEVMAAKMAAENIYRSRVQSSELNVQKKLDQLRWQLIKDVITQARLKMADIVQNETQYKQLIIESIQYGVTAIGTKHLLVEFNQTDYHNMAKQWDSIIKEIKGDVSIELSKQSHLMSGGIIMYDQKRSIRIDNTFEGRIDRLSESIHQLVAEQFFSELSHESEKIHGR